MGTRFGTAAFIALLLVVESRTVGATIGPLEYHSIADSPFDLSRLGVDFFLEDFSQDIEIIPRDPSSGSVRVAKFSTPGVYETGGRVTVISWDKLYALGTYSDFWAQTVMVELSFEFAVAELGYLPQAVGFVTSNALPVTVNFYGPKNSLVETVSAAAALLPDPVPPLSGLRNTVTFYQRDRFFGAIHRDGITRVDLLIPARSAMVDDFQYGRLIPEPGSVFSACTAAFCMTLTRSRREGRLRLFFAQRY